MATSEVAGATVSTAFASTQSNSVQRGAQQELQASARTNSEGASGTSDTQSVTGAVSSDNSGAGSSGDPSRGTQVDITV